MKLEGVLLPIITPFNNGKIDFESYKLLIENYISKGISGIIPLGTTGESPTITDYEFECVIDKTIEYVNNRLPIYVGIGGNNTSKVVDQLEIYNKYKINGILSVVPYYNRPSQQGIYNHFKNISECTNLDIILYNIPYRTGVNISNETVYKLAEFKNIIGIKDSCGDIKQSTNLLLNKPNNFSVLTGEDYLFYTSLTLGGDGGILASAHINTDSFVKIYENIKSNNYNDALKLWKNLYNLTSILFEEPNPAPLKYYLKSLGMIKSFEVRLPLTDISEYLKHKIDKFILNDK